jgi:hypothetical protein
MPRKRKTPFDWFWDDEWISKLFSEMRRDMERMFKPFEEFKGRWRTTPRVSGFSLRIFSNGKGPPRIEFSRTGPPRIRPVEEKPVKIEVKEPEERAVKAPLPAVERYEEAPYTYNVGITEVTVELGVKGIENPENLDLKFYPESLEIRAAAPKTGKHYFAVLKIPPDVDRGGTEIKVEKDKAIIRIPRRHALRYQDLGR